MDIVAARSERHSYETVEAAIDQRLDGMYPEGVQNRSLRYLIRSIEAAGEGDSRKQKGYEDQKEYDQSSEERLHCEKTKVKKNRDYSQLKNKNTKQKVNTKYLCQKNVNYSEILSFLMSAIVIRAAIIPYHLLSTSNGLTA